MNCKNSLIRDKAAGSSASLQYVLWILLCFGNKDENVNFGKGHGERQVYIKPYPNGNLNILWCFSLWLTERFHSPGQHLCTFIATKESVCIRKEFNSHRIGLEHQHGFRFIVLGHQWADSLWRRCLHFCLLVYEIALKELVYWCSLCMFKLFATFAKLLGGKTLIRSYTLCKFWGFSDRVSPKLSGMSDSNFKTEIFMLFRYSEISFY